MESAGRGGLARLGFQSLQRRDLAGVLAPLRALPGVLELAAVLAGPPRPGGTKAAYLGAFGRLSPS